MELWCIYNTEKHTHFYLLHRPVVSKLWVDYCGERHILRNLNSNIELITILKLREIDYLILCPLFQKHKPCSYKTSPFN